MWRTVYSSKYYILPMTLAFLWEGSSSFWTFLHFFPLIRENCQACSISEGPVCGFPIWELLVCIFEVCVFCFKWNKFKQKFLGWWDCCDRVQAHHFCLIPALRLGLVIKLLSFLSTGRFCQKVLKVIWWHNLRSTQPNPGRECCSEDKMVFDTLGKSWHITQLLLRQGPQLSLLQTGKCWQ